MASLRRFTSRPTTAPNSPSESSGRRSPSRCFPAAESIRIVPRRTFWPARRASCISSVIRCFSIDPACPTVDCLRALVRPDRSRRRRAALRRVRRLRGTDVVPAGPPPSRHPTRVGLGGVPGAPPVGSPFPPPRQAEGTVRGVPAEGRRDGGDGRSVGGAGSGRHGRRGAPSCPGAGGVAVRAGIERLLPAQTPELLPVLPAEPEAAEGRTGDVAGADRGAGTRRLDAPEKPRNRPLAGRDEGGGGRPGRPPHPP